jgi:hypothetical protein
MHEDLTPVRPPPNAFDFLIVIAAYLIGSICIGFALGFTYWFVRIGFDASVSMLNWIFRGAP